MIIRKLASLLTVSFLVLGVACTSEVGDGEGSGDGDSSGDGDLGDGDAAQGTGGASGGGLGSGGYTPGGGGLGSGGDFAGTGGDFAGTGGDFSGTGGLGSGGGDSGTGGGGGGDAVPSAGCGMGGRPDGGRVYEAGVSWLVFPEKYDGNTPLPVLFGWHGCGGGNRGDGSRTEWIDATSNSGFSDNYILAAPLSSDSGGCYNYGTDIPRAKALYTELANNYCIDTSRVFGTGHSSGAGFLVEILANQSDFDHFGFRGIAPVAAWVIGGHSISVPAMYIQGIMDAERGNGNGQDVVNKFISVNSCQNSSSPYAGVNSCNSSYDGASVDAGCVSYAGCTDTLVWCSHNDKHYGGTYHGIPCFFKQAAFDFFESL